MVVVAEAAVVVTLVVAVLMVPLRHGDVMQWFLPRFIEE